MLVGLFLIYLLAFIAVLLSIQWIFGFLAGATAIATVTFFAALGGMGAIIVLARHNLTGIVIAVAIMVFWSFLLFGAEPTILIPTLTTAAIALYAVAAITLLESFLRQWVPRNRA
jgi:hypothetical protein